MQEYFVLWKTIVIFFLFIYRNIFLQFDKYHGQWIEAEAEAPSVCRLNQDFRESELGYP